MVTKVYLKVRERKYLRELERGKVSVGICLGARHVNLIMINDYIKQYNGLHSYVSMNGTGRCWFHTSRKRTAGCASLCIDAMPALINAPSSKPSCSIGINTPVVVVGGNLI